MVYIFYCIFPAGSSSSHHFFTVMWSKIPTYSEVGHSICYQKRMHRVYLPLQTFPLFVQYGVSPQWGGYLTSVYARGGLTTVPMCCKISWSYCVVPHCRLALAGVPIFHISRPPVQQVPKQDFECMFLTRVQYQKQTFSKKSPPMALLPWSGGVVGAW